jgi:hypothetical protein
MTNDVIFGDHIKTAIGFATSGSVAKTIGTVTPLQVLINLAKTGEVSITNMTALGTLGSAAVNMAVNGVLVSTALETGIVVGSGINALYQTYVQKSHCSK